MRFDRPIGILLLLWPTLWALWIAGNGSPTLKNVLIFVCGVVLMRAAGCVMNDIADRDFDPHVERTRIRPLAAGELTVRQAIGLFLLLMAIAFGLVLMTNALAVKLSFAGAALASTYPFFKRFTHWPQVIMGMAFGWGIPMSFAAETGSVPAIAWYLWLANIIWSVIYDTMYAMVDRQDDLKVGVKSSAIALGDYDLLVLRILSVGWIAYLAWIGARLEMLWPFWLGLAVAAALLLKQHWNIRNRDRHACFRAFLNNNWVGAVLFAGIVGQYLVANG
jgi:4-hydroxybenzoate polyprenyltransferase